MQNEQAEEQSLLFSSRPSEGSSKEDVDLKTTGGQSIYQRRKSRWLKLKNTVKVAVLMRFIHLNLI